jgi:acetyl esterase/lipase
MAFTLPPTIPATPELLQKLSVHGGETLPLWPAGVTPPKETAPAQDSYYTVTTPYTHGDHLNLFNVWQPEIEVFPAPAANNTGAAVIVAPGGCYQFLSYTMEGAEMAAWLNGIGVTCAILKYRVPTRPGAKLGDMELTDAQRALSLLRANAARWGIDPKRVGIMGFSAGAHLSALAGNAATRTYAPIDATDGHCCKPTFTILMYPAYIDGEGALEPKIVPTENTSPAIMIHAADDPFPCESSLYYLNALRKVGVSAELHFYSTGGHGYGLRPTAYPCRTWSRCVGEWLEVNGWLKP